MIRDILPTDNFPREFYGAVGRLAIEFGVLEYLIKLCIKDLEQRGFHEGMLIAERLVNFGRRSCHAKVLAQKKLTKSECAVFLGLLEKADDLAIYRNDTLHSFWTIENEKPLRVRIREEDKAVDWSRGGAIPIKEIEQKAANMKSLHKEIEAKRMLWSIRRNAN